MTNERRGPHRCFALSDAMILVAATAVGLSLYRIDPSYRVYVFEFPHFDGNSWSRGNVWNMVGWVCVTPLPMLVAWTPAVAAFGLLGPRDGVRASFRRPGLAACMAATLAIVMAIIPYFAMFTTVGIAAARDRGLISTEYLIYAIWKVVPLSIVVALAMLALSGYWRRGGNWVDRLRFAIALMWVVSRGILELYLFTVILLERFQFTRA
ncbi:hypothetical protein EP7_005547 (plasmid) [Isosphaeraceae bacterium EP7]